MNILDEDIPKGQRLLLESWHIRVYQIGVHIGHRGMADEAITPLLLRRRRPTFFTRDEGFYDRSLCHTGYSLIYLDVNKYLESTEFSGVIMRVWRACGWGAPRVRGRRVPWPDRSSDRRGA